MTRLLSANGRLTSGSAVVFDSECSTCGMCARKPSRLRLEGMPIAGRPADTVRVTTHPAGLTLAAFLCFGLPLAAFSGAYFAFTTVGAIGSGFALMLAAGVGLSSMAFARNQSAVIERKLGVSLSYVNVKEVA